MSGMMTNTDMSCQSELPLGWERAIFALLSGATREKAAEAAGVSARTVYRWQQEPAFKQQMRQERAVLTFEVTTTFHTGLHSAVACLREVFEDRTEKGSVRVQAA